MRRGLGGDDACLSVCMVYVRYVCVCMLEAAKNRRRRKNRGWVRLVKCDL